MKIPWVAACVITNKRKKKKGVAGEKERSSLPVAIRAAMIAEIVVLEITNTATDNAPMYINVTQVKKRAKKPPAAAKDTRRDMTMALTVAARKKSVKTSNPVKARRVIVPTCSTFGK